MWLVFMFSDTKSIGRTKVEDHAWGTAFWWQYDEQGYGQQWQNKAHLHNQQRDSGWILLRYTTTAAL